MGKGRDRRNNRRSQDRSGRQNSGSRHTRKQTRKDRSDIVAFLKQFDIEEYRERARFRNRHFVLHIGPTNSGKTYGALQALQAADTGVYLGPLRLLALEMYDTINANGVKCELLTGEEFIRTPGAKITASTIELQRRSM